MLEACSHRLAIASFAVEAVPLERDCRRSEGSLERVALRQPALYETACRSFVVESSEPWEDAPRAVAQVSKPDSGARQTAPEGGLDHGTSPVTAVDRGDL